MSLRQMDRDDRYDVKIISYRESDSVAYTVMLFRFFPDGHRALDGVGFRGDEPYVMMGLLGPGPSELYYDARAFCREEFAHDDHAARDFFTGLADGRISWEAVRDDVQYREEELPS